MKGTAVISGPLTGLSAGTLLVDGDGAEVGTVSRIVAGPDGTVRNVLVRASDGRTVPLSPTSFNLSGETWAVLVSSPGDDRGRD